MTAVDAVLETGTLVDIKRRNMETPPPDATPRELVFWKWPGWCHEADMAYAVEGQPNMYRVPTLIDWRRNGDLEEFDVALPSGWAAPQVRAKLEAFLPAAQGASESIVLGLPGNDNGIRVVLSHFRLPELLPFDDTKIPESRDTVYLGLLVEGSDFLWDLRDTNHGLIAGQTNSGKTEAVGMVLAQLHLKGWGLRIITPKWLDSKYTPFGSFDQHTVITGQDDEHLEAAVHMLEAEQAEMKARAEELADVRSWSDLDVEFYGDEVPGYEWKLRPSLVLIDEAPDYLEVVSGGPDPQKELKQRIRYLWEQRLMKGREYRQHGLAATQTPNIASVGGAKCWGQLGMRCGIRHVSQDYVARLFPKADSGSLSRLADGSLRPGRAVLRGAAQPENALGAQAVNDAFCQIAWWPRTEREAAMGLREAPDRPLAVETPNAAAWLADEAELIAADLSDPATGVAVTSSPLRTAAAVYVTAITGGSFVAWCLSMAVGS